MGKSIILAGLAIAVQPIPAPAQNAAPATTPIYVTGADVAAAVALAAAAVQPGHGTSSRPILALGDYTAKVEVHVGPNIANAHPRQAELFHTLEGSGMLVTGGTIVKTASGASISGGTARHIAAGDVFIVPEGVPHWFNQVDGRMVLISVMLPRPEPAAAR